MRNTKRKIGTAYLDPKTGRMLVYTGKHPAIHWSGQMLSYLRRNYATTTNREMVEWLGVSSYAIRTKAAELGLRKDQEWLRDMRSRNSKANIPILRASGKFGFRKGHRPFLGNMWKKGHKFTEEENRKRAQAIRRYYLMNPEKAKERTAKAVATRRERGADKEKEQRAHADGMAELLGSKFKVTRA